MGGRRRRWRRAGGGGMGSGSGSRSWWVGVVVVHGLLALGQLLQSGDEGAEPQGWRGNATKPLRGERRCAA